MREFSINVLVISGCICMIGCMILVTMAIVNSLEHQAQVVACEMKHNVKRCNLVALPDYPND